MQREKSSLKSTNNWEALYIIAAGTKKQFNSLSRDGWFCLIVVTQNTEDQRRKRTGKQKEIWKAAGEKTGELGGSGRENRRTGRQGMRQRREKAANEKKRREKWKAANERAEREMEGKE